MKPRDKASISLNEYSFFEARIVTFMKINYNSYIIMLRP